MKMRNFFKQFLPKKTDVEIQEKEDIISNYENEKPETDSRIPKKYCDCDIITLKELSKTNHSFWKFTQSKYGLSHEVHYAKYELGKIEEAVDEEEWLSLVSDENIGSCIGYGDRLTKLLFDPNDKTFASIQDEPVIIKGTSLGELTARRLIAEEHFSIKDPETICKIISMSNHSAIQTMFYGFSPIDKVLKKFQFEKSLGFVEYIKETQRMVYKEDIEKLKKNIFELKSEWEKIHCCEQEIETNNRNSIEYEER